MTGPPLALRAVTVRFGATVALDAVDLEVASGAVTALVGPNGAGKTTALRLAAGLVRPAAGAVRVFGLDPVARPAGARRRLGLLPDRPALPPYLTVRELLELRGAAWGLSRAAVAGRRRRLAGELALEGLEDLRCGALSHGQAQRAALAAVLLPEPPLLLVDEPMTALDLAGQRLVAAALARRAARGCAVVLTTHTVSHVAALADRVVALSRGRVAAVRGGTDDARELESWLLACSS